MKYLTELNYSRVPNFQVLKELNSFQFQVNAQLYYAVNLPP